jgi:hypothetical protein
MFGLLILLALLFQLHNQIAITTWLSQLYPSIMLILFAYYLFLQLNFSLLSHNFGIRQGDIVDFRYFYFIALTVILFACKLKSKLYKLYSYTKLNSIRIITHLAYLLLLLSLFYITTLELWSDLLWRITKLDLNNSAVELTTLNILLVSMLLLRYLNIRQYAITLVLLLTFNQFLLVLIIIYLNSIKLNFKSLHVLALFLILFILVYSNYTTTIIYNYSSLMSHNLNLNLPLAHTYSEKIESIFNTAYSSLLTSNLPDTKPFYLTSKNQFSYQDYEISSVDIGIQSSVKDYFNIIALAVSLTIYVLYLKLVYKHQVIRF